MYSKWKSFLSLFVSHALSQHSIFIALPPWQLVIEVALADKRGQPLVPVKTAFEEDEDCSISADLSICMSVRAPQ